MIKQHISARKYNEYFLKIIKSSIKNLRKRALFFMKNKNIKLIEINNADSAKQFYLSCMYNDLILHKKLEHPYHSYYSTMNNQKEIYEFLLEFFKNIENENYDFSNQKEYIFSVYKNISSIISSCNNACWFLERQLSFYEKNNLNPDELIQTVCSITLYACCYCGNLKKRYNWKLRKSDI